LPFERLEEDREYPAGICVATYGSPHQPGLVKAQCVV
jgi:hypothetical protein